MSDKAEDYPVVSVKFENPIPLESWMLEKQDDKSNYYHPNPEPLTEQEQWIENWLYQNCFEQGWGSTTPTVKQLAQMIEDYIRQEPEK